MARLIDFARTLFVVCAVAAAFAQPAASANLTFSGILGYAQNGTTVDLAVARIDNNDAGGVSGKIRVELWASAAPYSGGQQSGYRMAQYVVADQLTGGGQIVNIDSGYIPFQRPPDGTWYVYMLLTEYVGGVVNDGYDTRDYFNFSKLISFGGAPGQLSFPASVNFGDQLLGTTSATQDVVLTNMGGTSVTFTNLAISDSVNFGGNSTGCTTLDAGSSCTFHLSFHPQTVGAHAATITITSDGLGSPQTLSLNGNGFKVVTLIEYHHSQFDHYFVTPVPAEIALLDAHQPPFQYWSRTGLSFNAFASTGAPSGSVANCRFFNDHFAPKSSHFYAPHGFGCEATLELFPDWTLEDAALFNTMLSDPDGSCPLGTIPLYRLYNQGQGGAPNHRFVTSLTARQTMITRGYIPEGNGIGVGNCVPP